MKFRIGGYDQLNLRDELKEYANTLDNMINLSCEIMLILVKHMDYVNEEKIRSHELYKWAACVRNLMEESLKKYKEVKKLKNLNEHEAFLFDISLGDYSTSYIILRNIERLKRNELIKEKIDYDNDPSYNQINRLKTYFPNEMTAIIKKAEEEK